MRRFLCSFDNFEADAYDFDVIIVGSGVAGLYAALHIDPALQVALVTKSNIDESNSYLAQGGIAAVMTADDNYVNHIDDTLKAGAGLCNVDAVKVLVEEGPENIRTLIDMQIPFDVNSEGDLQITREGGHRMRRIVHCGGDATGKETTMQLGRLALERENLHFFFESYLVDILTADGAASGVLIHVGDDYKVLRSRNIIIATGGIGQVFAYTTNPLGAVGDGIAAAARAGARVCDMELIQFHPTTLISSGKASRLFLISEAVRGEGGILRNKAGEAFMAGRHELADLAPRDIVTREIIKELERTGDTNVFLDVSSMTREFFSNRFPTIFNECESRGIRLTADWIPVRPAQHYLMGGIRSDLDGQTNIPGLYCCGECAETGIHGANRLASNSLLECLVFGRRCARHINAHFRPNTAEGKTVLLRTESRTITRPYEYYAETETKIKRTMSEYAGAVRTQRGLAAAKAVIDAIGAELDETRLTDPYTFKVYNMYMNAAAIVRGAIDRKESVGAHYLAD